MRSTALLLCAIVVGLAPLASGADAPGLKTVYLFPMANGFDQYLANRISASGLFQVTADPAKADAVLTDRLGEVFERRMAALFPAAKSSTGQKAEAEEAASRPLSSFSRSKGIVFLVDAASRIVVWSTYMPSPDATPAALDRTAQRVVEALKRPAP